MLCTVLIVVLVKATFLLLYKLGVPKQALFTVLGLLMLGIALYVANDLWPNLFRGEAITDVEAEAIHRERYRQFELQR